MKTNFKKTLAVLMAVLMLASVFSVTVFAASYTVTYMPGEGVEGEVYVDTFTTNIKLRSETYTRDHYTHTGWATEDGGVKKYNFNATYRTRKNLVLYPVWTGDVYTITYDPGQYATSGTLVTDTANYGSNKALKDAIFTREGYVQAGWSLVDGGEKVYDVGVLSDAITGDMVLYPYWVQMYNIVYNPGQYGVGNKVTDIVEGGQTFSTRAALFTREGYRQIGWSLVDGGDMEYELSQNHIPADKNMELYPYWLQNIYDIEVSTESLYFGDLCEGYTVPEQQVIVVKNTGNVSITLSASSLNFYNISLVGSVTLAAGESIDITVQPKVDLPSGECNETLVLAVAESADVMQSIELEFSTSEHVYGKYTSNNDATYTNNGTMTAYCVKGCGSFDTIEEVGSKKFYSSDNNDAVGLASSYEHHRTVRFTAYGSGMDDAEGVVGKRFVPVSWYVNDEFNGTFEDGKYDVVFTHTLFGSYTLTINYVEEEFDATTGEWVATGVTDEKIFDYTVGTTAKEEQEIVRPNTILSIIFGLLTQLLSLLGIGA